MNPLNRRGAYQQLLRLNNKQVNRLNKIMKASKHVDEIDDEKLLIYAMFFGIISASGLWYISECSR